MLKIEHVLLDPTSLSLNQSPTNYPRTYFLLDFMTKICINGIMIPIVVVVKGFCQQYCCSLIKLNVIISAMHLCPRTPIFVPQW